MDHSNYGLGAILSQIDSDNVEKTVAFVSRTLYAAERKYSVVEKEALACVWAVERWRSYLWRHRVTLRKDHQALTTLLTTKGIGHAGMRIARWSLSATDLDFASAEWSELSKLWAQIAQGWPPSPKGLDSDLLPYYRLRLEIAVKDKFVFCGSRLIVPTPLCSSIVSIAHKSHQGVVCSIQRLCELY
ncbi:hypothetical protein AOLI_G00018100 [Acnodon oligacanthus]